MSAVIFALLLVATALGLERYSTAHSLDDVQGRLEVEDHLVEAGEMTKILTGIRARIDDGWVLKLYPRSGLGFKFRLQLNNTVGIIDSDYYGSDNEGHIQVKLTNDSREGKTVEVEAGTGFSQGIFVEYGITVDDEADEVRNGGFGSTTRA